MSAERSPDVRRSPPENNFGGSSPDPRGTRRSPRVSARIRAEPRRKVLRRANCLPILLPLILQIVNASLSQGSMDGVKQADIIPLLKNNSLDPNVLKNFRPVSNLTFLGKLIERVVLKRLNEHLSNNDLHCPEQSAYKKNCSTETLLVRIWNDLLVASDEKSATVVMMLDLSAAFDTVDHDLLLHILMKEIGLRGTVLKWFESFLKGRSQRIRLGSIVSDEIIIKFGVPQGSVLGPVLFNLYIRSIYRFVQALNFNIFGYADDHQILKQFKPVNQGVTLLSQLKDCFKEVKLWMRKYYLAMNDSKTQIIVFGPTSVLNEITINGLNIGCDTTIRFVSTVKNLGIYMDAALTMKDHITELKKKCFLTLRNLKKIRFLLTTSQVKTIVNSLVISCLDYCNSGYWLGGRTSAADSRFPAEKLPPRTSFRRGNNSRVRVRVRVRVMVL